MAKLTIVQQHESAFKNLAAWRRNYSSTPKRILTNIVPFVGTKSVFFNFSMWGLTEKSVHNTVLMWTDVPIYLEEPQDTLISNMKVDNQIIAVYNYHLGITYKGGTYWIQKPIVSKNPCVTRCSCSDYYFTFAYPNYRAGLLYGPMPRPYHKKTNRKPRNPNNVVGICKHVFNATQFLQTSNLVL